MTTLKAHFDGKYHVPDEPVNLPTGRLLDVRVEVIEPPQKPKTALQRLVELAERFPAGDDLPTDLAAQHDHYLYGTPKRENP